MPELWDLYNEKREKTGLILERGKSIPQGLYHIIVSAWIMNSQGQYLISQRHPNKPYPGYWECTGGSVIAGESSLTGAVREIKEELGIVLTPDKARLLYQVRRDTMQDFYDVWLFQADVPIKSLKLQIDEVINAQWVSKETLSDMFQKKRVHPLIDYMEIFI